MSKSYENLPEGCEAAAALPVVRRMIRYLRKAGFTPYKVFDGEEDIRVETESQMLDEVFGVDEATAYFTHPDRERPFWVLLFPCNGEDVITDCGAGDTDLHKAFDAALDAAMGD
jgi:hypothetical protein